MTTYYKKKEEMNRFFEEHNLSWDRLEFILKISEERLKAYLLGAGLTNKLSYEEKMLVSSFIALIKRRNIICPDKFGFKEYYSSWVEWSRKIRYRALKDAEVNLKAAEELLYIIMDRDVVLEKNECQFESTFGDLEKLHRRYTIMMQLDNY